MGQLRRVYSMLDERQDFFARDRNGEPKLVYDIPGLETQRVLL